MKRILLRLGISFQASNLLMFSYMGWKFDAWKLVCVCLEFPYKGWLFIHDLDGEGLALHLEHDKHNKTISTVTKIFYWPQLWRDVTKFVNIFYMLESQGAIQEYWLLYTYASTWKYLGRLVNGFCSRNTKNSEMCWFSFHSSLHII